MVTYHVEPLAVADLMRRRPHRVVAVFLEPLVGVVKEILFAPKHPGQCLPHHIGPILADTRRGNRPIELVGLAPSLLYNLIKLAAEGVAGAGGAKPQPNDGGFARAYAELIVRGSLGPYLGWG